MKVQNYYYLASGLFFVAAVLFFISDNASLGAAFVAIGSAFIALGASQQAQQGTHTVELDAEQEAEVRALLLYDRKVEAVKRVRELSGASLLAAKTHVDNLENN